MQCFPARVPQNIVRGSERNRAIYKYFEIEIQESP
jgi:hypothetical protein